MPTVVIVDDQSTNRQIFRQLAASLAPDIVAEAFARPSLALRAMHEAPPDLVISDYKMPEMNGAEFIERLRRIPGCSEVPVIVITAYQERISRLRALDAGATDFLQSPVDHQEFVTRARNLLRLSMHQKLIHARAVTLEQALAESERSREALLRDSSQALAQVIDTVPAMISATDREGRWVFVNAYQATLAGDTADGLTGRDAAKVFGAEHAERHRLLDRLVFESGQSLPQFEETLHDRQGVRRTFLTTKKPLVSGAGAVVSVLTTSLDITERKLTESRLEQMAHRDALTGIANREVLRDHLQREIARIRRGGGAFALHFLDLDRFKTVNDAFGHHVGDLLLQQVADRLRGLARAEDTVARLGGDEFALLQTGCDGEGAASEFARRIIAAAEAPFFCNRQAISISGSVGITLFPRDGGSVETMLQNADTAMYRAKTEGRNGFRFFSEAMNERALEAIALESDLRHAVGRRQIVVHYQPQISLRTGQICGVEALVRWERPGYGLLRPGEFLPVAEETGLISAIDQEVLRQAATQVRHWAVRGYPPLRLAVNLSAVHLAQASVSDDVLAGLAEAGLPPSLFELELTESTLVDDARLAAETLTGLRSRGVQVAIDDFGTGYSSLSYVRNLPADRLKIDQSFVRNLRTSQNDAAIVRAIISLAHSLNMSVIAEGVETADQVAHLLSEGCDEVQGYYFSQPLAAPEFEQLLRRRQPMLAS